MRHRDQLTPQQKRELEALDRALAGEPVEPALREFEDLVQDIRATAPEMSPGCAARLEHEVEKGFPTGRERAPSRGRALLARPWFVVPAVGSLAAVLVAVVVVLGARGEETATELSNSSRATGAEAKSPPSGGGADGAANSASPAEADTAAPAPAASQPPMRDSTAKRAAPAYIAPPSGGSTAIAPQARVRRVERSAVIVLQAPDGRFESTTDAVIATVARFKGIVANSQIGASDTAGGEATFDLRIPTQRLDQALAALSKLGHVTERSQDLQDITASFASAQERLTDARAERRGLLRALARATTQQQIDSLKARLRSVGSRIANLKGQLASLRRRADLSRVDLTVRGTGGETGGGVPGGGHWTPGDAADDALRVLEVLAGVTLIALAVLAPLGLLAAATALALRAARRRRRASALDPA